MKLQIFCVAGILAVSVLSLHSYGESPATQSDLVKENALLKAKISTLEGEILDLKMQLAMTQKPGNSALKIRPFTLPQGNHADSSQIPPNSIQQQFNGMTYYLAPIEGGNVPAQP